MYETSAGGDKKIENIIKEKDLRKDLIHPERRYTIGFLSISKINLDSKYLVRELNEKHKKRLMQEIREEGLIEPITVNKEPNGNYTLIAGQHRIEACKELKFKDIDAKIYWELDETTKMLLGYMSNESRKRPAAGDRYESLYQIFNEKSKKFEEEGKIPCEQAIINETYLKSSKMKVTEIIKGIMVAKLRKDSNSKISEFDLIQNAQVPRKKIVNAISNGTYPLFTAQNVFLALSNLCRQKPISIEEEKEKKNYRDNEYCNVRTFFNKIVEEFIQPWLDVKDIDPAINFCRRHPFDAFTKLVAELLVQERHPSTSSKTAPFYHTEKIDWDKLFDKLKPLKDSKVWKYPPIVDERSVSDILYQIRYYLQNGEFKN